MLGLLSSNLSVKIRSFSLLLKLSNKKCNIQGVGPFFPNFQRGWATKNSRIFSVSQYIPAIVPEQMHRWYFFTKLGVTYLLVAKFCKTYPYCWRKQRNGLKADIRHMYCISKFHICPWINIVMIIFYDKFIITNFVGVCYTCGHQGFTI